MSKRRHKKAGHGDGGHETAQRWLLTYADLIPLLMVFFVVLYSMSQADSTKFKRIIAALQQAFNVDVLHGQSAAAIEEGSRQHRRAELKPTSLAVLDAVATELRLAENDIRVDGHTDSTPLVDSPRYPTNWEL